MVNYNNGYGNRDDDGYDDRNDNKHATSVSGPNGPIFDPITKARS